jgi:hypothetical protein
MKLCTLFLIALWMAIACPRVLASTTAKATFDGTYTVINVTWIDDGLDGGRPSEHVSFRCDQTGGVPIYLMFFVDGTATDSSPSLRLYPNLTDWGACDGRGVFQGVARYYKNPFTVNIPGNVTGKTLCYGTKSAQLEIGPFPGQRCTTVGGTPEPVTCVITQPAPVAHGDLASGAVQGNTSTTTAQVACTGAGKTVRVQAVASANGNTAIVPLRSDSSITSHLTVMGNDGYAGVNVFASLGYPAKVTITSTLSSDGPTGGLLEGNAVLKADGKQQPFVIRGNVIAQTAPRLVSSMELLAYGTTSNLGITWSWATTSADYGNDRVPANYRVGLFVRNDAEGAWYGLRLDAAGSAAAPWAERIQRFHDSFPQGGIRDEAPIHFGSGRWCAKLGAASTPETGGTFLPAPGAVESCVTVPAAPRPFAYPG